MAIEQSRRAGIRLIVLTGDHKVRVLLLEGGGWPRLAYDCTLLPAPQVTAESICRRIGVFGPDEDTTNLSFTGMRTRCGRVAVANTGLLCRC